MVFDDPQGRVTFTLGPYCGDYVVAAYDSPVGGALAAIQVVEIAGCLDLHGVHRLVRVTTNTPTIRRIEIDGGDGAAESIDDLVFGADPTPPIVEITDPPARSCVCEQFPIMGNAIDPDGVYLGDFLEYRKESTTGWTLATFRVGPATGLLYQADASALPGGWYFLRVTGLNGCNLPASDSTSVYVDKLPPIQVVRSPGNGAVVGGTVCFDGSVHENRGTVNDCLDHYTVAYYTGSTYAPVDPGQPTYTTPVVNDPFAHWDTISNGIPDSFYDVRFTAIDICQQEIIEHRNIVVDNTLPIAVIFEPADCAYVQGVVPVIGTVGDSHLDRWVLDFSGDGVHGWQVIATGSTQVGNGVLGQWDTSNLPNCAYVLRLRAWDSAIVNCNGVIHNTAEWTVSVNVGYCGDFDADDDGDVDLTDYVEFEDAFTGPN